MMKLSKIDYFVNVEVFHLFSLKFEKRHCAITFEMSSNQFQVSRASSMFETTRIFRVFG